MNEWRSIEAEPPTFPAMFADETRRYLWHGFGTTRSADGHEAAWWTPLAPGENAIQPPADPA